MTMRTPSRTLSYLLMLVLLVVGCGSAQPTPTTPARLPLKLVVFPFVSHAPFYIALAEGYFDEQGLDVELVQMQPSQGFNALIAQGKVDAMGALVTAGMLNAIARGANIKVVADKGYIPESGCDLQWVVVRSSLLEEGVLKDAASLRGRRIQTEPPNLVGFLTEKLLRTGNLTLDDVEPVILDPPEWPIALEAGSIDAVIANEPWKTHIVRSGTGRVWMGFQDFAPGYQFSTVLFGPTLIGENREAGKRFMVAYLKAVRQYNEGKTERNLDILVDGLGLEQELLQEICWPPIRSDGKVNVESLVEYADWAVEKGVADSTLTADQLYDPSFIEYANQVLGPTE